MYSPVATAQLLCTARSAGLEPKQGTRHLIYLRGLRKVGPDGPQFPGCQAVQLCCTAWAGLAMRLLAGSCALRLVCACCLALCGACDGSGDSIGGATAASGGGGSSGSGGGSLPGVYPHIEISQLMLNASRAKQRVRKVNV